MQVWNESFRFTFPSVHELRRGRVSVEVYDWDAAHINKQLGFIEFRNLQRGQVRTPPALLSGATVDL